MNERTVDATVGEPARPAGGGYCGMCGAALNSTVCERCARVEVTRRQGEAEYADEGRPLAVCLWLYGLLLGASMASIICYAAGDRSQGWTLLVQSAVEIFDAMVVLGFVFFARGKVADGLKLKPADGKRAWWWLWFPAAAGAGALTFGAAWLAVGTLDHAFGNEGAKYAEAARALGYGWWLVIVMTAVQPAIIEELAFRGIIQPCMARLTGPVAAIFVSAGMFMVLHLNVVNFPHLLLIGVVLGTLRFWSGSVYPGMVLHFVHNGLVILLEWKGS